MSIFDKSQFPCPYCYCYHIRERVEDCPQVNRVVYYKDGSIRAIELKNGDAIFNTIEDFFDLCFDDELNLED